MRSIYEIMSLYSDEGNVFLTEEDAEIYIAYLKDRYDYEFHKDVNTMPFETKWVGELFLYETAQEAIDAYVATHGEPKSGEERYKEFMKKKATRTTHKPNRYLVDADEFERFTEWKNTQTA